MLFCHIAGGTGRCAFTALVADSVLVFVLVLCRRILSCDASAYGAFGRAVVVVGVIDTVGKGAMVTADRADLRAFVLVGVMCFSLLAADVAGIVAGVIIDMMGIFHDSLFSAFIANGVAITRIGVIFQMLAMPAVAIHTFFAAIGLVRVRGNPRLATDFTGRIAGRFIVGVRRVGRSLLIALGTGGSAGFAVRMRLRRHSLLAAIVTDFVAFAHIVMRRHSRLAAHVTVGIADIVVGVFRRVGADIVAQLAVCLAVVTGIVVRCGILCAALAADADVVAVLTGLVTVGREVMRRVRTRHLFTDLTGRGAGVLIFVREGIRIFLTARRADLVAHVFGEVRRSSLVAAFVTGIVALGGEDRIALFVVLTVLVVSLFFAAVSAFRITAFASAEVVRYDMEIRLSAHRADLIALVLKRVRNVFFRAGLLFTIHAYLRAVVGIRVMCLARFAASAARGVTRIEEVVRLGSCTRVVTSLAVFLAGEGELVGRIRTGLFTAQLAVRVTVCCIGMRRNSLRTTVVADRVAVVVIGMTAFFLAADGAFCVTTLVPAIVVRRGCGIFGTAHGADLITGVGEGMLTGSYSFFSALVAVGIAVAGVCMLGGRYARRTASVADGIAVTCENMRCFTEFAAHIAVPVAGIVIGVFFHGGTHLAAVRTHRLTVVEVGMFRRDLLRGTCGVTVSAFLRTVGEIAMRRDSGCSAKFAFRVAVQLVIGMRYRCGVLFTAHRADLGTFMQEVVCFGSVLTHLVAKVAHGLAIMGVGVGDARRAGGTAVVAGRVTVGSKLMRNVQTCLFTHFAFVGTDAVVLVRGLCRARQTADGAEFGTVMRIIVFCRDRSRLVADVALTVTVTGEGVGDGRRAYLTALVAHGGTVAEVGMLDLGGAGLSALVAGRVALARIGVGDVRRARLVADGTFFRTVGEVGVFYAAHMTAYRTGVGAFRLVHMIGDLARCAADITDGVARIVVHMSRYFTYRTAHIAVRVAGIVVLMLGDPCRVAKGTLGRTVVLVCVRSYAHRAAFVTGVIADAVIHVLAGRGIRLAERAGAQTEERAQHREEQQDFLLHENLPYSIYCNHFTISAP